MMKSLLRRFYASKSLVRVKGRTAAWKITMPEDVGGEIDVDLERAYFLNFVPYILGALITTAGVMKRKSDEMDKEDEVLDAIIADED